MRPGECTDPLCPCGTHVTVETHYPCCPVHHTPLVVPLSGDPDHGWCTSRRPIGRGPNGTTVSLPCTTHGVDRWEWLPRALFHHEDMPPNDEGDALDLSRFQSSAAGGVCEAPPAAENHLPREARS